MLCSCIVLITVERYRHIETLRFPLQHVHPGMQRRVPLIAAKSLRGLHQIPDGPHKGRQGPGHRVKADALLYEREVAV